MGFLVGPGTVLDATRHDEELAGAEVDRAIAQLDRQATGEDEEEIVGGRVRVPDELALGLDDLNLVVVELGDDSFGLKCSSMLAQLRRPG